MVKTASNIHNEFRLFGIKIFSIDYVVTETEEENAVEEVQISPIQRFFRRSSKREEQIRFLEKLYRSGNYNPPSEEY